MVKVTLLDTPLVVGRDRHGQAFALRDACPHRGMPLSYGRFDGEFIQCSFHGWTYAARTGQCRFVPTCTAAQQAKVGKIRAGHVPCEERDSFIWVYLADPARAERGPAATLPPAPALPVYSERYRHFDLSHEVPISADHGLVSLMDPAHGPFVHRQWWVLARALLGAHREESRVNVEPIPMGFREVIDTVVEEGWSRRMAGADSMRAEADFVLPNLRIGRFRFGKFWFTGLVSVTPLTPTTCRFDQRYAWHCLYYLPFAATILKLLFWLFFVQDRRTLSRQAEGLGRIPRLTLMGDADCLARWYFQIKRAYVEAQRAGTEFVHPIREAVTLTYRNPIVEDMQRRAHGLEDERHRG